MINSFSKNAGNIRIFILDHWDLFPEECIYKTILTILQNDHENNITNNTKNNDKNCLIINFMQHYSTNETKNIKYVPNNFISLIITLLTQINPNFNYVI